MLPVSFIIGFGVEFVFPRAMMRIYVFKSQSRAKLRAFASDPDINRLPQQHGPWTVTGIIGPTSDPPYKLSRDTIEKAIDAEGFQLWRLRDKAAAQG